MLFGHDYYVRGTAVTNTGRIVTLKGTFEARFMDEKELRAGIEEEFKRKVWYEYGEAITHFTKMEVR